MLRLIFVPFLLFATPKALHLTYHAGCASEISALCKQFNVDVDTWYIPSLPINFLTGNKIINPYIMTKERANAIFNLHKSTFDQYDLIITSDIAPLSRIFLQNHFEKPLLIWVCNRFDINVQRSGSRVFPDQNYYEVFKSATNMPNVEIIGYTHYEKYFAEQYRNIHVITETITPTGLSNSHKGMYTKSPDNINKANTVFIRDYHNEKQVRLPTILNKLHIKNYCGTYDGASDIKDFKAMIHIPLVMSNLFLWENLAEGVVHFIPSKKLYEKEYRKSYSFVDWTKSTRALNNLPIDEIFSYCEWYREDLIPLFVFFDSYDEIPYLLETTNFQEKREVIKTWYNDYKEETLEKWRQTFSKLLSLDLLRN